MAVRIIEAEWLEYRKRPELEIEWFELEEEVPQVKRIRPRPRLEYPHYSLTTYDEMVMPMKMRYKQIAQQVKELAKRYSIPTRLISALVSVAIMATRRNMIGSIACLKHMYPSDYISSLAYKYCVTMFGRNEMCNEFASLCRQISIENYMTWNTEICKKIL